MKHNTLYILSFFFVIAVIAGGCKKLVEVPPPKSGLSSSNVFSTDATATAAATNIYSSISQYGPFDYQVAGMCGLGGLSADELTLYTGASGNDPYLYYTNN